MLQKSSDWQNVAKLYGGLYSATALYSFGWCLPSRTCFTKSYANLPFFIQYSSICTWRGSVSARSRSISCSLAQPSRNGPASGRLKWLQSMRSCAFQQKPTVGVSARILSQ